MATYIVRREPLVTCPYNPAHQVKRGRIQIHILKCRKAYPEMDVKACPFSAAHIVPASDLLQHIYTCPLNVTLDRFLTAHERDVHSSDLTVPPAMTYEQLQKLHGVPFEESWDEEATDVVSLEDKIPKPAVTPILANVQPMAPAERHRYYASLHSEADQQVPEDMLQPHHMHRTRGFGVHAHLVPRAPTTEPKVLRDMMLVQKAASAQYAAAEDESDSDDDDEDSDGPEEFNNGQACRIGVGRGCIAAPRFVAGADEEKGEDIRSRMLLLGLGLGRGRPPCHN